jgi:hypothetical protein
MLAFIANEQNVLLLFMAGKLPLQRVGALSNNHLLRFSTRAAALLSNVGLATF